MRNIFGKDNNALLIGVKFKFILTNIYFFSKLTKGDLYFYKNSLKNLLFILL